MHLTLLGLGALLLAGGVWALQAGKVLSTWGRWEYRPSAVYWITVAALISVGGLNVVLALRGLFR